MSARLAGVPALRLVTSIGLLVAAAAPACRREAPQAGAAANAKSDAAKPRPADLLVFPDELRVGDDSVDQFVAKAMTTCGAGEYEPFRLLWSARENPLPREEFEQGWHAVQNIRVRALEKVTLDADASAGRNEPESVYVLLAEVSLDPTQKAGQKDPNRHVVLMLAREQDQWRLARAPKAMRSWIKGKIAGGPVPSEPLHREPTD